MMSLSGTILDEPLLTFGHGQSLAHPKDGLFLYGPMEPKTAQELRIGAIGSRAALECLERWMQSVRGFIPAFSEKPHHAPFPGVEAAFGVKWAPKPQQTIVLPDGALETRIRYSDKHRRVYDAVDLVVTELLNYKRRSDVRPDVWMVVLPEVVSRYGRPKSKVPKEQQVQAPSAATSTFYRRNADAPFLFPEDEAARLPYQYELNFHNQLKARLLEDEIVTQVVRDTTLTPLDFVDSSGRPTRGVQDAATTAWNLLTTLYYKVAGPPWRLTNVRPDVCYIGLVYKEDASRPRSQRVCCGAQMFLGTGEGVVFRGHLGPWDSVRNGEHHLDADTAEVIIREVVESYREEHLRAPAEIFIHGRTRFTRDEWSGFQKGASGVPIVSAIQIQQSKDVKLFRDKTDEVEASLNVARGTALIIDARTAYLWTTGYVPRLHTYPGWEVPNPYRISVQRGDADIRLVLADVLGLTKLNFNACIFADGQPVTLRFADAVGEILTAGHEFKKLKPLPFKFYI